MNEQVNKIEKNKQIDNFLGISQSNDYSHIVEEIADVIIKIWLEK